MRHLTYGENWLYLDERGFRLPPVLRGPTVREIPVRGNPPLNHEWYVARDVDGRLLYEGISYSEAQDTVGQSPAVRAFNHQGRDVRSHLIRRHGILAPGEFSVRMRPDGIPVIVDERDSSDDCLLFLTSTRSPSAGPVAGAPTGSPFKSGRRLMGGSFSFLASRHDIEGAETRDYATVNMSLAVVVLRPGEMWVTTQDTGSAMLLWEGNRLSQVTFQEGEDSQLLGDVIG